MNKPPADKTHWLDRPQNGRKIVWGLGIICLLLLAADFFYHKHAHFSFEHWFGFYAGYGFFMCVAIALAAKVMRAFLKRDEDYYD